MLTTSNVKVMKPSGSAWYPPSFIPSLLTRHPPCIRRTPFTPFFFGLIICSGRWVFVGNQNSRVSWAFEKPRLPGYRFPRNLNTYLSPKALLPFDKLTCCKTPLKKLTLRYSLAPPKPRSLELIKAQPIFLLHLMCFLRTSPRPL